jgi:2-polyprenyl-6-methoxyphenol hydroxylase-like FAD-dependent oxidoreductase
MKTRHVVRVCVVGAGLAGLACALAAAAAGAQVEVMDERSAPSPVPAHVEVVPNLLRDLVILGVADDCVKAGFPYRGVAVTDPMGRAGFELPTQRLAPSGYPEALGLAYDTLATILARSAMRCGARMRWGVGVKAVTLQDGAARLELVDGSECTPDLVLLATGAGSHLRDSLHPGARIERGLGGEWTYALLPRPRGLDRALHVVGHEGERAFVVPVSAAAMGVALSASMASSFGWNPAEMPPALRPLLAHASAAMPRVVRPVQALLMQAPWHRGNVLCVGECAHALPPHFGQAAAQVAEDAVVLKDLLQHQLPIDTLVLRFGERRHARAARVFDLVAQAARWHFEPQAGADLRELAERLARLVAIPA